jgi:hypothetical protein
MIRQISIDIPGFINNWLPVHRRKNIWLGFLQVLLVPFRTMMSEYKDWRDASIMRAYVSSQTISMEWYLNELYDPIDREIRILTADPSGFYVAMQSETAPVMLAGLQTVLTEAGTFAYVPLPGEDLVTGMADFVVHAPLALMSMEAAIRKVVNNYKLAGKRYTIVYI